jgi:hypothetical protein
METPHYGVGLDFGADYLIVAPYIEGIGTNTRLYESLYLSVNPSSFDVQKLPLASALINGNLVVLGSHAKEVVGVLSSRFTTKGFLSAADQTALAVLPYFLHFVGVPRSQDEPLYFCTSAPPIDLVADPSFHNATIQRTLSVLGFKPWAVERTRAISHCLGLKSGIFFHFGYSLTDVMVLLADNVLVSFSTANGSAEYIDRQAASFLGYNDSRMAKVREQGVDLNSAIQSGIAEHQAVALAYKEAIQNTILALFDRQSMSLSLPIYVSGTILLPGFIDTFRRVLNEVGYSTIANLVRDPVRMPAEGCLLYARMEPQ